MDAGSDALRSLTEPPDPEAYRRQRCIGDFYARARLGPAFYAAGILVIAVAGRYFRDFWPLIAIWLCAYVMLGYLRVQHRPPALRGEADGRWWREHWILEKVGVVFWAVAFLGVGLIEGKPSTVFLIAVICTIAYASAVADVFAMARIQAMASLVILVLPGGLGLYLLESSLRPALVTLGVYSLYLFAYAHRRAREYEDRLAGELELLSSRAAVDRLSRTDPLTGLANRREYVSVFSWLWQQHQRMRTPLTVLVLDLDHFKRINDRHGHAGGDVALTHAAEILRESFRRTNDFVARIGGEEFVVLLPGVSIDAVLPQAEALCERMAASPVDLHGEPVTITVSIGLGEVDYERDTTPDSTFMRIDRTCYDAKQQGRNRVVIA